MVARNRNTVGPPPPHLSLHRRAALIPNSNETQSAHKGVAERGRSRYRYYTHVYDEYLYLADKPHYVL
jgi:hypothetical protein